MPCLLQSFESFSEDPHLSGTICTAYIKGVQSGGIGATIKHFVYGRTGMVADPCADISFRANDMENGRMGYDVVMSPRALREIYLMPFMLAQKYARPWSIMTAYVEHLSQDIDHDNNQLQPCRWSSCF